MEEAVFREHLVFLPLLRDSPRPRQTLQSIAALYSQRLWWFCRNIVRAWPQEFREQLSCRWGAVQLARPDPAGMHEFLLRARKRAHRWLYASGQFPNSLSILEAPVGIEPTNSRFAVCRLTTWPRRRAFKLFPDKSFRQVIDARHDPTPRPPSPYPTAPAAAAGANAHRPRASCSGHISNRAMLSSPAAVFMVLHQTLHALHVMLLTMRPAQ